MIDRGWKARSGTCVRPVLVLIALATAAPCSVFATGGHIVFAPDDVSISFTLDATAHTVRGTFRLESGELTWDESGDATGRFVVDASSGRSGNARRDRKMHRDVLESELYPLIVFEPTRIDGRLPARGEGRVVLRGDIQIHGARHPVEVEADLVRSGRDLVVEARFEIPYVEWGLEDPSVFVLRVAKRVQVGISLRATLP